MNSTVGSEEVRSSTSSNKDASDPAIVMNTLGLELNDLAIDLIMPNSSDSQTFQDDSSGWGWDATRGPQSTDPTKMSDMNGMEIN